MSDPALRRDEAGSRRASGARWARGIAILRDTAALCLVIAVTAVMLSVVGVGCPIKFVTGISCPGCGMTRAWLEALQLHLDRAVAYHPLFWIVPIAVIAAVVLQSSSRFSGSRALAGHSAPVGRRVLQALLIAAVIALLVLWIWRLIEPNDLLLFGDAAGSGDVVNIEQPGWMPWVQRVIALAGGIW